MGKRTRSVRPWIFTWDEDKAREAGFMYSRGQVQLIIEILKKRDGELWNSKELERELSCHPDLTTNSPIWRIVNQYVYRFKKAGLIREV